MKTKYPKVPIRKLVVSVDKWNPSDNKTNEIFTYIDISSVSRETKQIEEAVQIWTNEAPSRARQLIKSEDVIVSTVRPNLNAVAYTDFRFDGATASTGFTVLRTKQDKLNSRYLYYWTRTPYFIREMTKTSTGASYPAVSDSIVKDSVIPLPPLEEQRRIAGILDKADEVRRQRQEAIRLTEELLKSLFLDMFGDPVTNPKGWEVKPMYELIQNIKAGWSVKGEERRCEGQEWGVLKISAVTFGRFQPNEHKVVQDIPPGKSLIIPKRGDLLFSRANTRELVAATCLVEKDYERLFLPDKLWKILPNSKLTNTVYLRFLIAESKFRGLLAKKATGTSGSMLNVSQQKLLEMNAPVPDLERQNYFAETVWKIYGMQEQYGLTTNESSNLFNSLLQKAFRGEL
ncbi:putative type I restriction enzyme specificity protein (plasmid) [Calothrix parasitica NIES-267]|uniref:Putative type I restriction enzyme specificity protein n=1 Tax=Calothrix parasitica NIES-267 TaxID=1973488 RepID=A0A1Z4M394_9CYAN|nr:putative type I restriction enzyme specificity protein [Calothrix parasitica NIES-267]